METAPPAESPAPAVNSDVEDETLDGLTFSGERFAIPATADVVCVVPSLFFFSSSGLPAQGGVTRPHPPFTGMSSSSRRTGGYRSW